MYLLVVSHAWVGFAIFVKKKKVQIRISSVKLTVTALGGSCQGEKRRRRCCEVSQFPCPCALSLGMCNSFLWASELVLACNMWMQEKKRRVGVAVFIYLC